MLQRFDAETADETENKSVYIVFFYFMRKIQFTLKYMLNYASP